MVKKQLSITLWPENKMYNNQKVYLRYCGGSNLNIPGVMEGPSVVIKAMKRSVT